jgi:carbohydrate-selective porin OprB
MGSYREAIAAFLRGAGSKPDLIAHRQQGRIKYGFGFNAEQELTSTLRAFARVGWNEGRNESFAYTEVNQSIEVGTDWRLAKFGRSSDKLGLALMSNGISRLHQLYLALGGQGFLLGDGRLSRLPAVLSLQSGSPSAPASSYAREDIAETYYNVRVWRGTWVGPDIQFIEHPAYNRDRGPVFVPAIRLHLEF